MPAFNMNGNNQKKLLMDLLLEWLNQSAELARRRKKEDALFLDYTLTLNGVRDELKEQSDHYSRQLIAADPYKAIAQMITVAEAKGELLDFSFVNEEMYELIPTAEREKVRNLIEEIDRMDPAGVTEENGKEIPNSKLIWTRFTATAFGGIKTTEEIMELEKMRMIAVWTTGPQALTEEEKKELDNLTRNPIVDEQVETRVKELQTKNAVYNQYVKDHENDVPVEFTPAMEKYLQDLEAKIENAEKEKTDDKNETVTAPAKDSESRELVVNPNFAYGGETSLVPGGVSDRDKEELKALKFMKRQWEIYKHPDKVTAEEKKLTEDQLFRVFVAGKALKHLDVSETNASQWLGKEGKIGLRTSKDTTLEDFLVQTIDKSVLKSDRENYHKFESNRGNSKMIDLFATPDRGSVSFIGKVHLCEQGVETAFSKSLERTEKLVSDSMKNDLYHMMHRRGGKTESKAKDLAVITKGAHFLKRDVSIDVYDRCEKDRASITARQIQKNEGVVADRNKSFDEEVKEKEVKQAEKTSEEETIDPIESRVPTEEKEEEQYSEADYAEVMQDKAREDEEMRAENQKTVNVNKSYYEMNDEELNAAYHLPPTEKQITMAKAFGVSVTAEMVRGELSMMLEKKIREVNPNSKLSPFHDFIPFEKRGKEAEQEAPDEPIHEPEPPKQEPQSAEKQSEQPSKSAPSNPSSNVESKEEDVIDLDEYFITDEKDADIPMSGTKKPSGNGGSQVRTYDAVVEDKATNTDRPATVVETPKGNVVVDADAFQQNVAKALEENGRKEVEGAGITTAGTLGFMLADVASDLENGNIEAVANIIKADVITLVATQMENIDNFARQIGDGIATVAESLNNRDELVRPFVEEKVNSLSNIFEQGNDLSIVRPFQEMKLMTQLSPDVREEYQPVIDASLDSFSHILSDGDLTRQYFTDMEKKPDLDFFDLGIAAVVLQNADILNVLGERHREAYPEVYEEESGFDFARTCENFADRFCDDVRESEYQHADRGVELEHELTLDDD